MNQDDGLLQAHDLLWVSDFSLSGPAPEWLKIWHSGLPVVIRRDHRDDGSIPVGIRGKNKQQRLAAWVYPDNVIKHLRARDLAFSHCWRHHKRSTVFQREVHFPCLEVISSLCCDLALSWGICGSLAYELASGDPAMIAGSDIDIVVYPADTAVETPVETTINTTDTTVERIAALWSVLQRLPCRVDVQIEMSCGALSLYEYMHSTDRVMLKTCTGPILVKRSQVFTS